MSQTKAETYLGVSALSVLSRLADGAPPSLEQVHALLNVLHSLRVRPSKATKYAARKYKLRRCVQCGRSLAPGQRVYCETHRQENIASLALRRAAKKAAGICLDCKSPADTPFLHCPFHREKSRQRNAARRASKVAARICVDCQEPALPNHQLCKKHRDKSNEYTNRWLERRKANA